MHMKHSVMAHIFIFTHFFTVALLKVFTRLFSKFLTSCRVGTAFRLHVKASLNGSLVQESSRNVLHRSSKELVGSRVLVLPRRSRHEAKLQELPRQARAEQQGVNEPSSPVAGWTTLCAGTARKEEAGAHEAGGREAQQRYPTCIGGQKRKTGRRQQGEEEGGGRRTVTVGE